MNPSPGRTAVLNTAVAVSYVLAGRYGLALDAVSGFATLVWAPSGISLAAIVLRGRGMIPGVFLGALATNLLAGAGPAGAGIAVGNTAEAVVGAALLARAGFQTALPRVRDVLVLVGLAAGISTVVSAAAGVLSLLAAGRVAPEAAFATLRTWWLGDAIGDLVVGSFLLCWLSPRGPAPDAGGRLEFLALCVFVVGASIAVFVPHMQTWTDPFQRSYVLLPFLCWGALRFGARGAALPLLLSSVAAVYGTAHGGGPFARDGITQGLMVCQIYMILAGVTVLLLSAAVAEREVAVRAQERLAVQNQELDAFARNVTHDLRGWAATIEGFASIALQRGVRNRPDESLVRQAGRAAAELRGLMDDLRRLSISTRDQLRMERVDVSAAARSIARQIAKRERRRGARIEVQDGIVADADARLLAIALENLLDNAWKYTRPVGATRVTVSGSTTDADTTVVVRDNGVGFDPGEAERLFQAFTRLHPEAEFPGTGLGLATVRRIVERHGGRVSAAGSRGQGAAFKFTLPRSPSRPASASTR